MVLSTGLKTKLNLGLRSFHKTELKMGVPKTQVKQGVKGQASDEMKTPRSMGRVCVGSE